MHTHTRDRHATVRESVDTVLGEEGRSQEAVGQGAIVQRGWVVRTGHRREEHAGRGCSWGVRRTGLIQRGAGVFQTCRRKGILGWALQAI